MQSDIRINRIGVKKRKNNSKLSSSNEIIEKVQEFQNCNLCFNPIQVYRFAKICHCQHIYCQNCLMTYIMYKLEKFQLIACPQESCTSPVDEKCVLFQCLSEVQKNKYEKIKFTKRIQKNKDLLFCPDQNCPKGYIEQKSPQQKEGQCKQCHKKYCLKCMGPAHKGTKCDDDEAKDLSRKYKYRRCKGCKKVVERIQGCNHMTCNCGNQFCYLCGGQWSYDHDCPYFRNQETVCWKLKNCLDQFSCCFCWNQDQSQTYQALICRCFVKFIYYITYSLLVFFWVLNCILIGIILFILLIPLYLIRGNVFFFQEMCKEENNQSCCPVVLWFLFMPISIFFMAVIVFIIDTSQRNNECIWRICFTASCERQD